MLLVTDYRRLVSVQGKTTITTYLFFYGSNLTAVKFSLKEVEAHCCRLQAGYSPITVKNFVTVYTDSNLCN